MGNWIKINSTSDLPKTDDFLFQLGFMDEKKHFVCFYTLHSKIVVWSKFNSNEITHYREIEKCENPLN